MIYLDTALCVYTVESGGDLGRRIRPILSSAADTLCVSPLVATECMVIPYRRRDVASEQAFRDFFAGLVMLDVPPEAFDRASRIRATTSLDAVHALHMATALAGGCSALWTADGEFARRSGGFAIDILANR